MSGLHGPAKAARGVSLGRRGQGFTLIEILVVVFIIGVIAGVAILSIDTRAGADRLAVEARRLHALMEIAGEDAVLFGAEIGLDLTAKGYRFLRLETGGWTPIDDPNNPLRPRTLPEGTELRLLSTDTNSAPGEQRLLPGAAPADNAEDGAVEGPRPELLFLSSGEVTSIKLELFARDIDMRFLYTNRADGTLSLRRETPADT